MKTLRKSLGACLVGLVALSAVAGCKHGGGHGGGGGYYGPTTGSLQVVNQRATSVSVFVYEVDSFGNRLFPSLPDREYSLDPYTSFFNSRSDDLHPGYYEVLVTDYFDPTYVITDTIESIVAGFITQVQILPDAVPPVTDGELDIENHSGEDMYVYIDSILQQIVVGGFVLDVLPAGTVGQYIVPPGIHTLDIVQADTGVTLHSETINFFPGDLYIRTIEATDPIIEVENNLPLAAVPGLGAECVYPYLDGNPVQLSSGYFDVCQGEVGVFSVPFGTYWFQVDGASSGYSYFYNPSITFPQNYTTVIQIN